MCLSKQRVSEWISVTKAWQLHRNHSRSLGLRDETRAGVPVLIDPIQYIRVSETNPTRSRLSLQHVKYRRTNMFEDLDDDRSCSIAHRFRAKT